MTSWLAAIYQISPSWYAGAMVYYLRLISDASDSPIGTQRGPATRSLTEGALTHSADSPRATPATYGAQEDACFIRVRNYDRKPKLPNSSSSGKPAGPNRRLGTRLRGRRAGRVATTCHFCFRFAGMSFTRLRPAFREWLRL
ncbi:MipA/OmpV family protein [Paraburkholderia kirstenboschensis]|uniref:MipA/OmpV family protein n=1 Tax=Paraburkholderia kirstenboschensis TaxID=1245436 RepID=UPI001F369E5F|nr:MipA/OmpV family protein [Paraburkholderia kirstenboschensis]